MNCYLDATLDYASSHSALTPLVPSSSSVYSFISTYLN
jgi:hypothetical protein